MPFLTERMRSKSKSIYVTDRIVFRVIDSALELDRTLKKSEILIFQLQK